MNKLKALQAKIIEAVPDIKQQMDTRGEVFQERDITLEDVLIVIQDEDIMFRKGRIVYFRSTGQGSKIMAEAKWQLNKPLGNQSKETIYFLHNILCKK